MLLGAVNMVLFTALATLGAFVYNVCADLVGGVELTLAERSEPPVVASVAVRVRTSAAVAGRHTGLGEPRAVR